MPVTEIKSARPSVRDFLTLLLSQLDTAYPGATDCIVIIGTGPEGDAGDRFKQYGRAENGLSHERQLWLLEMGRASLLKPGHPKV